MACGPILPRPGRLPRPDLFQTAALGLWLVWGLLILRLPPRLGDAWWTPLRAAGQLLADPAGFGPRELLAASVHIDSIKLVPVLLELGPTALLGHWSLTASRLLGIASWLLVWLLLDGQLRRQAGPAWAWLPLRLAVLLLLLSGGAPFRFSTAFAIHRTLPALAQLASAWLLFRAPPALAPRRQLALLAGLALVSTFSFAHGALLWPAVAVVLALQHRWRALPPWLLLAAAAALPYRLWIDPAAGSWPSVPQPPLAGRLQFALHFLSGISLQALPTTLPLALIAGVLLAWLALLAVLARPWRRGPELSAGSAAFFGFVLALQLPALALTLALRGYTVVPARYAVESSLATASLLSLLTLVLIQPGRTPRQALAGLLLVLLPLPFWLQAAWPLGRQALWPEPTAHQQVWQCLRANPRLDPAQLERCELARVFWQWDSRQRRPRQRIRLADRTAYAHWLDAALGKPLGRPLTRPAGADRSAESPPAPARSAPAGR